MSEYHPRTGDQRSMELAAQEDAAMSELHARLTGFLGARLDELEATAKAEGVYSWDARTLNARPGVTAGHGVFLHGASDAGRLATTNTRAQADHIAANNPAHVLRGVEADRKLLAAYRDVMHMDREDPEPEYAYGRAAGLGEAVRTRAAQFSAHPDYDLAWAEGIWYRFGQEG